MLWIIIILYCKICDVQVQKCSSVWNLSERLLKKNCKFNVPE